MYVQKNDKLFFQLEDLEKSTSNFVYFMDEFLIKKCRNY